MENIKIGIGRLVIGSMLALGLASKFSNQEIANVYAASIDEAEDDLIKFTENGKKLQLIGLRVGKYVGNYEKIMFGYLYIYDGSVYLEDKIDNCTTNLSELDREYGCFIVYSDAKDVVPSELKENDGLTKEQALEISNRFEITEVEHSFVSPNGSSYFYTETFSAPGFDNKDLHVSGYSRFGEDDDFFFRSLYDKYMIQKEKNPTPLELGQKESTLHAYYTTASQTEPSGFKKEPGILFKYYAFNKKGEKIASLATQEEIDEFLRIHQDELNDYYWRAAFCRENKVDEVLDYLQNNQEVPAQDITYFIDYKIPSRK